MILISLSQRRLRKRLLAMIAVLALSTVSGFAEPFLLNVEATPYDHQMERVAPVLNTPVGYRPQRASLTVINKWMSGLRSMPYRYSPKWKTPAEVRTMKRADCKGKAVALYAQMRAYGARKIRLVIGKRHAADAQTHAWLEWETTTGTYLLDPTFDRKISRVDDVGATRYVPYYAYEGPRKYRALSYQGDRATIVAHY